MTECNDITYPPPGCGFFPCKTGSVLMNIDL